MHPALADAIVKVCRQRETEGETERKLYHDELLDMMRQCGAVDLPPMAQ